jgi:hypothetical protein
MMELSVPVCHDGLAMPTRVRCPNINISSWAFCVSAQLQKMVMNIAVMNTNSRTAHLVNVVEPQQDASQHVPALLHWQGAGLKGLSQGAGA